MLERGFAHRFGPSLNCHAHFHCCIPNRVFEPDEDGEIQFLLHASALTAAEIAGIGEGARRRVLRWFARNGLLNTEDTSDMLGSDNGASCVSAYR